jgi:hypothetical protein
LFSFVLFFSLAVFGLGYAITNTALDPDFVTSELDKLDLSAAVEEFVHIEAPSQMPDLNEAIYKTVSNLEPLIKERSNSAIHSVSLTYWEKPRAWSLYR